jgi:hypothetical protein
MNKLSFSHVAIIMNRLDRHHFLSMIAISLLAIFQLSASSASDAQISVSVNKLREHRCNPSSEIPLPPKYKQLKQIQNWCGLVKQELRELAPKEGYIVNNSAWSKLWKTYRGEDELPKINFDRQVILVYVHFDANALSLEPVLSNKGDLTRAISFTELGMSRDVCSYIFVSIDRKGIKTIEGKAISSIPVRSRVDMIGIED